MDVEKGWTTFIFTVEGAKFTSTIYLDDDKGVYSGPTRTLTGGAKPRSCDDEIYMGVPEDKSGFAYDPDNRLKNLKLYIGENDNPKWRGVMSHYVPEDSFGGGVAYLSLYLPASALDKVAGLLSESNAAFELKCDIECWHWIDPLGCTRIYIDPDERAQAQISDISVTHTYEDRPDPNAEEDEEDPLAGANKVELATLDSLVRIQKVVGSARTAAWVAAMGVVVAALL